MNNTEKKQILDKLFSSKWNYAWGSVDRYLIALFYEKRGITGLHDFVLKQKERMGEFEFKRYFSEDLLETLEKGKEITNDDFRAYILNGDLHFNKSNFLELEKANLLKYFYDYSDNFRGFIMNIYQIKDYTIIETLTKKERNFYNIDDCSTVFASFEEALLYQMFDHGYFSTLMTLLNASNKK